MEYFILDLERNMLWKKNRYGYTTNIDEALVVDEDDARKYVDSDFNKKTKQVTKEEFLNMLKNNLY